MTDKVVGIRGGRGSGGATPPSGGGGPEDPMLEQRVSTLESDMKDVKASLKIIETAVAEIKYLPKATDLARVEREVFELKGKVGAVEGRIVGIEGRLQLIPNTWQIIGILFAVAAVLFTASRIIR